MDTDTIDPLEAAMSGLDTPDAAASAEDTSGDLLGDFARELTTPDPEPPGEPEKKEDPPAAEPEAKEDPPAEDPEAIPDKPKNKDDWNRLRESRDKHKSAAEEREKLLAEREARLKEVETEREELRTKAARLVELEEKAKLVEEYEKELAITRLEATREYKESIAAPLKVIGEQAEILAKSNQTEEDAVFKMLNEADPVKQRESFKSLTAGWDDVDRNELWSMAKDARTLLDKEVAMRENALAAKQEQEEIASKREAQEKEASRKAFKSAADDAVKALREKVPFVPLADGETEDDRYMALAQKLKDVDFDSQSPRGKAFAAATALMYPTMVKMMAAKDAEIAELRAAVGKKQSGKPSVEPVRENKPPGDADFFSEFGIKDPASAMLGMAHSHAIDVKGA